MAQATHSSSLVKPSLPIHIPLYSKSALYILCFFFFSFTILENKNEFSYQFLIHSLISSMRAERRLFPQCLQWEKSSALNKQVLQNEWKLPIVLPAVRVKGFISMYRAIWGFCLKRLRHPLKFEHLGIVTIKCVFSFKNKGRCEWEVNLNFTQNSLYLWFNWWYSECAAYIIIGMLFTWALTQRKTNHFWKHSSRPADEE